MSRARPAAPATAAAVSLAASLAAWPAAWLAAWLVAGLCPSPARADGPQAWLDAAIRQDLAGDGSAAAAFSWYMRAAEAGLPEAEFDVAVMLDSGRGVGRDVAAAATWYARAAAHDDRRAAYNLGQLYEAGEGVPRNPDLARAWFAASDLPAARAHLAALGSEGSPGPVPPSPAGALTPPDLVAPRPGADAGPRTAELVWTCPPEPEPAEFFVEVRRVDEAGSREVFSGFTPTSSMAVALPEPRGTYAWRVLALARRAGQYAASRWSSFGAGPDAPRPGGPPPTGSAVARTDRPPGLEAARRTAPDAR